MKAKKLEPGTIINGIKLVNELKEKNKNHQRMGRFICPFCSNIFTAQINNVKQGDISSCGCKKTKSKVYIDSIRKPGYITLREAGQMLGIHASAVYARVKKSNIKSIIINKILFIPKDEVYTIAPTPKTQSTHSTKEKYINSKGEITDFYKWMASSGYRTIMITKNDYALSRDI